MIKQSSLLSVTILISSLSTSLFALDPRSIVQQWGPKAAAGATALYATYKLASDTAGYASGSTQADADILAAALLSGDQLMAAMNDPEANQYKNLSSLGKKKQIAEKMKTGKLVLAPVFYLDFVKYGFKSAKDAMNEEVFDEQLEKWSALTDSAKIQNIATRLEKGSLYLSAKKIPKSTFSLLEKKKTKKRFITLIIEFSQFFC